MNIRKADNINFGVGNVFLKRISSDNIPSYGAIKKLAEDKNIDIFITKNKETKYLPSEDMYTILALKERPVLARGFFRIGKDFKQGTSCAIVRKETKKEELSVKIFNSTMNAIDVLEKKLAEINKKK